MKKLSMVVVGIALFVAGYQHIRRQKQYIAAQASLVNTTTYLEPSSPTSASLKQSAAFRLVKPS